MPNWIILSYNFNATEGAASFHIDDRVSEILRIAPDSVFISGPLGSPRAGCRHHVVRSLSPAGIRYEIRHWVKQSPTRARKITKTALTTALFPLYLVEKILVPLETRWAWCLSAALRAWKAHRESPAEMVYSTGGPYCAHLAGWITSRMTGTPWVAELQDPIGLPECGKTSWDRFWNLKIETFILKRANATVWLTENAANRARTMQGASAGRQVTIRPWTQWNAPASQSPITKTARRITFTHLGTLGGSRNLDPILAALDILARHSPDIPPRLKFIIGGNVPDEIRRKATESQHADCFDFIGKVPRAEAHRIMHASDVLLVIQNTTEISCYTIPSKVYEYLNSSRRILAISHGNEEIPAILRACDRAAEATDTHMVADAIRDFTAETAQDFAPCGIGPESAVRQISHLTSRPSY